MSQISRQKDAEISNGNLINADDLDSEFNQLVNESNSQDSRLSTIEAASMTIQGVKTFQDGVKTDALSEATLGSGVEIEGAVARNGGLVLSGQVTVSSVDTILNQVSTQLSHGLSAGDSLLLQSTGTLPSPLIPDTTYYARPVDSDTLTLHATADDAIANVNTLDLTSSGSGSHLLLGEVPNPVNGQIWYNADTDRFRAKRNGLVKTLLLDGDITALPKGTLSGPPCQWVSAHQVKILSGFSCRDELDSANITFLADVTVNINVSGANGLDSGTEAADTWYYLWAISDSTGTNNTSGLLSTSETSPVIPSGYDKKRLIPLVVRNDAASNFIYFQIGAGWPLQPEILYAPDTSTYNGTFQTGPLSNVLAGGTATTWTAVSLSDFLPNLSKLVYLNGMIGTTSASFGVRTSGSNAIYGTQLGWTSVISKSFWIPTDDSQQVDYKRHNSNGTLYLDVLGFVITEYRNGL